MVILGIILILLGLFVWGPLLWVGVGVAVVGVILNVVPRDGVRRRYY